jgi:hypothetical protein
MVSLDIKVFFNRKDGKKFIKKGFSEAYIEELDDAKYWYVGVDDWEENGVSEKKINEMIELREIFNELIEKVFPDYAYVFSNNKNPDDELYKIFGGKNYYEALFSFEKWLDKLEIEYLEFVNEGLNGWTLGAWKIRKDRKDFKEIKKLIDKAKEICI